MSGVAFAVVVLSLAAAPQPPVVVPAGPPLDLRFAQIHPLPGPDGTMAKSADRNRAVVLIHGARFRPFSTKGPGPAEFHSWQKPDHKFVAAIRDDSDVFAFAYSQTGTVSDIAASDGMRGMVAQLRKLGYSEIALVGQSAGGVIARQFVEDNPDAGVTKVIQIDSPNTGTGVAEIGINIRTENDPLVTSLNAGARAECLKARAEKRIPDKVQFVCVVGDTAVGLGDLIVPCPSQWPADLRSQGIPAVKITGVHFSLSSKTIARKVADLIKTDQPRWDAARVAAGEKEMLEPSPIPVKLKLDLDL